MPPHPKYGHNHDEIVTYLDEITTRTTDQLRQMRRHAVPPLMTSLAFAAEQACRKAPLSASVWSSVNQGVTNSIRALSTDLKRALADEKILASVYNLLETGARVWTARGAIDPDTWQLATTPYQHADFTIPDPIPIRPVRSKRPIPPPIRPDHQ